MAEKKQRLLSLDVLRGMTVAGMILVNNGAGPDTYAPLEHAAWNGLTLADLVFPLFLFMVGISTYISLRKFDFKWRSDTLRKILKRTCLIMLICWGIYWFEWCLRGDFFPFDHLRIPGVLIRIALSYGIVSVMAITIRHKWFPWIAGGLLLVYTVLLLCGNGYEASGNNILSKVDLFLFGKEHLYAKSPIDPEGFLGLIASVAHAMIGFWCGKLIMEQPDLKGKMLQLSLFGFALLAIGMAFSYGLPFNKRIWSPTFVLFTCGLGASMLALLMYIIDDRNVKGWTPFFVVFGVNPLFIYVFSELLASVFGMSGISEMAYGTIVACLGNTSVSSLVYAVAFVTINWLVGYILYKRNIYIKI